MSVEQMSLSWARAPHYPSVSDAILGNIGNDLEYAEMEADVDDEFA